MHHRRCAFVQPRPCWKSLNRLLSHRGYCSRKEAEWLIRTGKVMVNHQRLRNPFQVVPIDAHIEIDGVTLGCQKQFYYAVLNKRRGTLTTTRDEHLRPTVYDDLLRFLMQIGISERLFVVGRLDKDTDGLLLFSNNHHFAEFLTNPRNQIPRTYCARLSCPISDAELEVLRAGVRLEARGRTYFAQPKALERVSWRVVELTLTEGKNREVRRLFETIGNKVERLTRIRFGNLCLSALNLPPGEACLVQKNDIWNYPNC